MSQISLELHHQISQFLYREAKLLDDWKFREWLDTLAEDISYTLRTTPNAQTRDRRRSVEPPTTWDSTIPKTCSNVVLRVLKPVWPGLKSLHHVPLTW